MTLAEIPVAVLAGGLATRLGSLAAATPKVLLDVAGRPFLDHQLELLRRRGLRRVVLCLGHRGEPVAARAGDGSRFGLEIACSHDGPRPLGTAGALRRALPLLGELFFVLYGDAYLDMDYAAALEDFEARGRQTLGLMTVFRNAGRWDRSNARFADGRLIRYDKRAPAPDMSHIDYGLGLLRREAVEFVPAAGPADLADLYASLVSEGRLLGHEVTTRFYEIGSPSGLAETRAFLADRG
jgi:NDP-sugar pyrophosphorylase family protein